MTNMLLIATLIVLTVVAANRLAGDGSAFRAKWDAFSDRHKRDVKEQKLIPVTKRFLVGATMYSIAILAFWAWLHISDGASIHKTLVGAVLFGGVVVSPLVRLYREYRKPGHGTRYKPQDNYDLDDDW
jgi:hypothetical protein